MPKANLTARSVERLQARPGRSRDVVWDKSLPGFGVRISGDSRTYYCTYRLNGRFTWFRLGDVSKVSLGVARERARKTMSAADTGLDPAAEKAAKRRAIIERRSAVTFEALAEQFIDAREPNLSTTTSTEYRRMVAAYVAGTPLAR